MTDADTARQFWSAAFFYRRAPDRNRATAIMVLTTLSTSTTGIVQSRAADILKEIANVTDQHTPGPG
ncbi:hypothetical protein ACVWWG_007590 [Bradyrhizobium sp. LB7.2]